MARLTKCIKHKNEFGRQGWLIQFPYDQLFLNDEFKDCIHAGFRQWFPNQKAWWVDESCGEVLQQLFENWNQPILKKQVKQCNQRKRRERMTSLRDKLLDVIASGLPDTKEMEDFFCGGDGFSTMLDKVMDTITDHITEALREDI